MPELWLPPEDRLALWEPVADQVRVIGWRPGPAGVSAVDIAHGLTVVVDHASPTTLAEIAVDLVDGRVADDHLPLLANLVGDEAVDRLRRLPRSSAGTRPTQLPSVRDGEHLDVQRSGRPRRGPSDAATAFARVTLATDLGDDAVLSDAARAVAWLEAATGAIELDLRALVPGLVSRSLELLEVAPLSFDPKLAYRITALAAPVARAAGDILGARLRRATERMTARPAAAPRARTARPAAAPRPADVAFPAAAAMAAPLREAAPPERAQTVPVEVDGDHPAWAGLTPIGHVHVTAGHRAEGTWARVFRRSDRLLLGLSPLRPGAQRGQLEATVVIPITSPDDLVVDVVRDASTPRRSATHDAARHAVLAGRAAARLSRRRDPEADAAWSTTAARWRALGDVQRANLAERHRRTRPETPSLIADEVP